MKALVTGATGFIGKRLLQELVSPVVLTRDPQRAKQQLAPSTQAFAWDAEKNPAPTEAFTGVDTIFHLAGDPVAQGRWTAQKKQRIRESRVRGTKNLVQTLRALPQKPKALISASAVGYYGNRGEEILDEHSSSSEGYLQEVCKAWEQEALAAQNEGIRVVLIRIGIVLGRDGGALSRMLLPFRMGLGGPLGNGKQWMPWVHIDDVVGLMLFAANTPRVQGPLNAVAPGIVNNRDFTKSLGKALRRPAFLPAPGIALRLALGEFAQVLLASQRVTPKRSLEAGYQFRYPDLGAALHETLSL